MLRSLGRLVRRRLGIALLLLVLLLLGGGVGVYAHALRQWQAAQQAMKDGRVEDARRCLELCLLVWPRSVPVHILAARAARSRGDFETAEAHLNRCLALDPEDTDEAQLEFLLMRVQRGEVDDVTPLLMTCVDNHHPQTALILETLCRSYMHNLRYGPAAFYLERWIKESPDDPRPYHWRGWVRERMNNHEGAIADYLAALELDPELVPVRLRLAEIYLEHSNAPKALPHLQRLLKQFPDRPDVMARMGQCRFELGETKEARRLLEAAREEMPSDPMLLIHLAKLDLGDGQPGRAEQWLRQILKRDPTDTEARFTLVKSLQRQGRASEAATELARYEKERALLQRANKLLQNDARRSSTDPDELCEIGSAFFRAGQERLGKYWLNLALERDPRHQASHRALAEHFEKKGDKKNAAEHRRWLKLTASKPAATPATPGTSGPAPGH